MSRHFMNKSHGAHMEPEGDEGKKGFPAVGENEPDGDEGGNHPDIHIQSHAKGHTVHILHQDGRHEKHEHGKGDAEGIASHIHQHIGGNQGQDHGGSSGYGMENEFGGGPGV